MQVRSKSIRSVGKEFWRLVEVYIFVVISSMSGSAIHKDYTVAKSKSKEKTLRTTIELFNSSSAPPNESQIAKNQNEPWYSPFGEVTIASLQINTIEESFTKGIPSHRAIEKGKLQDDLYYLSKQLRIHRLLLFEEVLDLPAHKQFTPYNLLQELSPLLI